MVFFILIVYDQHVMGQILKPPMVGQGPAISTAISGSVTTGSVNASATNMTAGDLQPIMELRIWESNDSYPVI